MAEIETEKALVEYAAEEAGLIGRLVLAVGDTGEIGDPIAVLISPDETDADIDAALGSPAANATPASPAAAAAATANGHHDVTAGASTRVFASPLVRKIAGEKGVDLAALAGTGPHGRIVRRDLQQFLAARPAQAPAFPAARPGDSLAAPPGPTSVGAASRPR